MSRLPRYKKSLAITAFNSLCPEMANYIKEVATGRTNIVLPKKNSGFAGNTNLHSQKKILNLEY